MTRWPQNLTVHSLVAWYFLLLASFHGLAMHCSHSFILVPSRHTLITASAANNYNNNINPRLQKKILLIDDEESIRQAVGQFLREQGYQVVTCSSPSQVSTSQEDVDAIICDVRMPIDGIDWLQSIRTTPNHPLARTPVILLTAKSATQDRIRGYQAGADVYLTKPFDPEELLSICDNVMTRFQTLNGDTVKVDELQKDLLDIQRLLLLQGGQGVGNGWVEATNVFLAPDERQLIELVSQGWTNAKVGEEMNLSTRRVANLLTVLYKKVGVTNRTELVRWAVSTGNVML